MTVYVIKSCKIIRHFSSKLTVSCSSYDCATADITDGERSFFLFYAVRRRTAYFNLPSERLACRSNSNVDAWISEMKAAAASGSDTRKTSEPWPRLLTEAARLIARSMILLALVSQIAGTVTTRSTQSLSW